ncbi:hypothetical protein HK102_004438, partial [Quaeritorhiza haematococci]
MSLAPKPLELLLNFMHMQSERVAFYKELEKGYEQYLNKEASDEKYRALMKSVTTGFSSISLEIQAIAEMLQDILDQPSLATLIRDVQTLEKKKLEMTVKYQIRNTETKFGQRDYASEIDELKQSLTEIVENINEKLEE